GGFALGERRIIEEGEAHGAFDFEGAVAGEKHRGRVRVDALDRTSTTRCMVGEKRKHLLLALALAHARHPCAAIIRPPPVMTQLPHVLKRIRLNSLVSSNSCRLGLAWRFARFGRLLHALERAAGSWERRDARQ